MPAAVTKMRCASAWRGCGGNPISPWTPNGLSDPGWTAKLTRTIILKDGPILHTLADVRAFILNGPEHIQECQAWQHTAQLLLDAAEDAGRIEDATRQVEFALFLEERLVLK